MTEETKKCIYSFAINTVKNCDIYKDWELDKFILMRLALIRTLAENIAKFTEV